MKVCYFTATGNSLYVAKKIGGELLSVPQLMRQGEMEISDDAVGIVCPVYAGQMPMMVKSFIEKAKIQADYIFMIYTFGMSETVAKPNAFMAFAHAGKRLDYVNTIKMVDNYLPGFEMKQQKATAGEKRIDEHIEEICRDIQSRKVNTSAPGIGDKIGMAVIRNTMGKMIFKNTAAQKYIVNDSCIKCGICAKVCPSNNISVTDRVQFSDHCEVCYACLHNCPKNAIHLKSEKSTERFRNENITVKEIIAANE